MSALSDVFSDIANAIRAKTGKSETMTPAEMVDEILNISSGGGNVKIMQVAFSFQQTTSQSDTEQHIDFGVNAKQVIVTGLIQYGTSDDTYVLYEIDNDKNTCGMDRIDNSSTSPYGGTTTHTYSPQVAADTTVNGLSWQHRVVTSILGNTDITEIHTCTKTRFTIRQIGYYAFSTTATRKFTLIIFY